MVRMRGVTTMGVGWASGEASDLVELPLNLVLYMRLDIFAYTSNTLITGFEYMDWMVASGTLKNFRFLLRSCLFTEFVPVINLTWSTFQSWRCNFSLMVPPVGFVLVLQCTFSSSEVPISEIWQPLMFQNAKDTGLISHGWEDRYSVRSHPPESFFHYYLPW